jgi:chromosome segregation ATPase
VLDALKTPGLTPDQFGATLDAAGYGTKRDAVTKKLVYGAGVARNAKDGGATAKQLVKKFMPQILDGQRDKIASLRDKQAAYDGLIGWIEQRVTAVNQQISSAAESSEQLEALHEELRQLEVDRETALAMREKIEPLVAKEQQLLADIAEFGQTLTTPGAARY